MSSMGEDLAYRMSRFEIKEIRELHEIMVSLSLRAVQVKPALPYEF